MASLKRAKIYLTPLIKFVHFNFWGAQKYLNYLHVTIPTNNIRLKLPRTAHHAAHMSAVQPPETVALTLVVGCSTRAATTPVWPLQAATTREVEVDIKPVLF